MKFRTKLVNFFFFFHLKYTNEYHMEFGKRSVGQWGWGMWLFWNIPNLLTDLAAEYARRVISSIDICPWTVIITVIFLITVSYLELRVFLKSFQVHFGVVV